MSGRIVDAILVARDLLTRYPHISVARLGPHPMSVANEFSKRGIAVCEKISTAPQSSILHAVRDSAAKIRNLTEFNISIIPVPVKEVSIALGDDGKPKSGDRVMRSLLLRYGTKAEIRFVDALNDCWKRFVVCKELAHLIMGEGNGTRAESVEEQLAMAYAICNDAKPETELSGEQFAWFVAAELLLPFGDRAEMKARKIGGETDLSIARSYWAPSAIISMLFDTPYGEISNNLNDLPINGLLSGDGDHC